MKNFSRRSFLKLGAFAAVAATALKEVAFAAWEGFKSPPPAGKTPVDPEKDGKRVNYVHMAKDYKGPKGPKIVAGAHCATCQFYKPDASAGGNWGACQMLAMKYVYTEGMCQLFSKKP